MILFLLSAFCLWVQLIFGKYRLKGDIPPFFHKWMYKHRDDKVRQKSLDPRPLVTFLALSLALFFGPFVITIWLASWFAPTGQVWATYASAPVLHWIAFFGCVASLLWHRPNLKKHGDHYRFDVVEEDKKQTIRDAYGSKGWATDEQIARVLPPAKDASGNPVGIHIGHGWHWYAKGHMFCLGGSGSGKGVSIILPAILSNSFVGSGSSLFCLDPKGENAAVAAPFLRSRGYDVHIINPFNIMEIADLGNSRWNPFDLIEPHQAKKMCDVLAYSLHNRNNGGDGSFFDNKCRNYISLYMRYALHTGKGTMSQVYHWLMLPPDKRLELLSQMATDENGFPGSVEAENIMAGLSGEAAKTEENIFGTIQEAVNILADDALRLSLDASDFDMKEIAQRPTAIFLCVRHDELRYYAAWVRMLTDFLLKTLTVHYSKNRKVLVLLDEFAQLGYVDQFKHSPAILRGYNVTLWPIIQELGQIQAIYGKHWETFISNAVVKHWLGGSMDNTTAKYIEQRMPFDIRFIGNNPDGSPKEMRVPLMTANEIMNMQGMICELTGLDRPIMFNKVPYWDLPFSRGNASANPFY